MFQLIGVLNFQAYNSIADRAIIMVANCQHCAQSRCVGCLTGFLGCRCRGYEQSSGNSTLVCIGTTVLIYCIVDDNVCMCMIVNNSFIFIETDNIQYMTQLTQLYESIKTSHCKSNI